MSKFILCFLLLTSTHLLANKPPSEIYQNLLKLKSLKRVLYIAAHPDDENTRALAYFSLGENAQTAYLSLTRGDGGQNLIGGELSEDLGVLRTQELLAARRHDKANQFFSRAVDFGYSKNAEETFEKWGKENVLSDVVLVIRKFKPDVIITRFPPDKRGGHGHHTASAIVAIEAFEKAADPDFRPDQVEEFGTWKANAVYWNSSTWWDKELAEKAKDNSKYIVKDIGGYNPYLGMSYNEIGTIARSQHKCQGFGAVIERGSRVEYFEHLAGEELKDFFENQNNDWSILIDKNFSKKLNELIENFNFVSPEKNIVKLGEIRKEILKINDEEIQKEKLELIHQIILDCAGLYSDFKTSDFAISLDDSAGVELTLLNRSGVEISLTGVSNPSDRITKVFSDKLQPNVPMIQKFTINSNNTISNPFWLNDPFTTLYHVEKKYLGAAENEASFAFQVNLNIEGIPVHFKVPLEQITRDPAYGERRRPVISTPSLTASFDQKLTLIKPGETKKVKINFHSFADSLKQTVKILAPKGWKIEPREIQISSKRKHEEIFKELTITANETSERGYLILANGDQQLKSYTEISYDHIPTQVIFKPSQIELIKLDAKINKRKIAYIKGVKDAVPDGIRELGFEIDEFEVEDLAELDLAPYGTVVLGIRIYNVKNELKNFDQKLFDYVAKGGRVIMQYNTASRWARAQEYGPKPFKIGRKRVTEEDAKVTFLIKEHPVLNQPNKITEKDFDNWVQERGLYFADSWDDDYKSIFAWNDKGEEPTKGALIILNHGKGQFIYTGISFFRELPNGVEGAFKLFANLLSYE